MVSYLVEYLDSMMVDYEVSNAVANLVEKMEC